MIDKWIIQDIEKHMACRNRVVVLDPMEQFAYLLPVMEQQGYTILRTNGNLKEEWQTVKEELFLRCEAERMDPNKTVVFYVTRSQNKLSFLFDYSFTHGCIDMSNPAEWLKNKLFSSAGLQVGLDNPLLLTAAKVSMGKSLDW